MKTFERDVRNLIVGGLLVLFVLAGVSLIVLRNMASWGERQYRERLLAATQILADQLARAGDQAFSRDVETGRLLWDAGARSAALYDAEGRQIVGATFLTDPGLSPPHLPHGERPSPLEPLLTLSLAAPPRITVTALIPGDTRVVRVVYDGSALASARHTRDAVTILVPGAALVLVLFAFPFLKRLTRPIRALTETARDAGTVIPEARTPGPISSLREEASEAVATFARTIEVLKQRTGELDRMRQIEKERADALAVTAATLVRTHPGGLLVIDAVGRLAEANPPALHALGATRDAVGKPAAAVLAVEALRDAAHRAAKGEPTLGREFTLGEKAGERRFAVTAVPVVDAAQKRLGTLLFLEDRTKTNRLERELSARRELAALGEMSAGIAHEFRNATATIVGYARLAATTDDPEARARQLAGIRTEAEHVARVTGDFLFFARPGRLVAARTPLEPLVRDVVEDERTAAADVTLEVTGAFAEAPVDAGLFRRALVNLLRNAREAATAGGRNARIVVRGLGTQEGLARIAVEDDGPGVPAEDAPKLFVPFYSTKESGTGLGLALVAKIAALHGGSATVERSEALGGARFVLSFALGDER